MAEGPERPHAVINRPCAGQLPVQEAPLRLRIPTKLGFKNPKYISAITVMNTNPGGYWEDQGYNWFSGS